MMGLIRSAMEGFQHSFLGRFLQKYGEDQAGNLAVILAYNALFSMFPILLSLITLVGFVLRDDKLLAQVQSAILQAFPSDTGVTDAVQGALTNTRSSTGWLGF